MQFFYERYKRVIKLRLTKKFLKKIKLNPYIRTEVSQNYLKAFLNNYFMFMKFYRSSSSISNSVFGIAKSTTFLKVKNASNLISYYLKNKKIFKNFFNITEILKKKNYPTLLPVKVSLLKLFNFLLRNRQFLQKLFQLKKTHQFSRIHLKSFKKTQNRFGVYNYIFKMEQRLLPQFFFSFLFPKIRFLKQLFINGNLEINNQLVSGYNRFIKNMDIIALPKSIQFSGINFIEHGFLQKIRLKLVRIKSYRHVFLPIFLKNSFQLKLFGYNLGLSNFFFSNPFKISLLYFLFFLDLSFQTIGKRALQVPYTYYYRTSKVSQIIKNWMGNFICFKRFMKIIDIYKTTRKNYPIIDIFSFKYQLFCFFPNFSFLNNLVFFWLKYLTQHNFLNIFFQNLSIFCYFKSYPRKLYQFRKIFFKKLGDCSITFIYNISYCLNLILFILFSYFFMYFNSFFFFKKPLKKSSYFFFRKLLNMTTRISLRSKYSKTSNFRKLFLKLQAFQFISFKKVDYLKRYYEKLISHFMQPQSKSYKYSFLFSLRTLKFFWFINSANFIQNKILVKKLNVLFLKLNFIYIKFKMILKLWYLKKKKILSSCFNLKNLFIKFKCTLIHNFLNNNRKFFKNKEFFYKISATNTINWCLKKGSLEFPSVSSNSYDFPQNFFQDVKYYLKNFIFNIEQKKKIFLKHFLFLFGITSNYFFTKNNLLHILYGYEYFFLKLFLIKVNTSINFFIFSYAIIQFFIKNQLLSLFMNSYIEQNTIFFYFFFDQYKYKDLKCNNKLFNVNLFLTQFKKISSVEFSPKGSWFNKFCLSKKSHILQKRKVKHPYPFIPSKFQKFFLKKKIDLDNTGSFYQNFVDKYEYQELFGKRSSMFNKSNNDFSFLKNWRKKKKKKKLF
jgi:hypothetical protein